MSLPPKPTPRGIYSKEEAPHNGRPGTQGNEVNRPENLSDQEIPAQLQMAFHAGGLSLRLSLSKPLGNLGMAKPTENRRRPHPLHPDPTREDDGQGKAQEHDGALCMPSS